MLASWLRRRLALTLTAALVAVVLAWAGGLGLVIAATLGLAVLFLPVSLAVAVSYRFARRFAYTPPPALRVASWRAGWAAVLEWLATLAVFLLLQPFERQWMGSEALGPRRQVVLLIHGYLCNRGMWWWLRRGLRAQGRAVATVNLEPPFGGIEDLAEDLRARVESLIAETGADGITLVGHSLGGLVARAYLRRHGPGRVTQLVTLGSPHNGTRLACRASGRNARDMEPDSAWMRSWAGAETPPVPSLSVWSARDNYVMPQDSCRLPGARDVVLPASGHLSMAFSPKILEILLEATSDTTAPTGTRTRTL